MLDSDLAELYQVSTKRLNEQVKRNKRRFPTDFMFQLSVEEAQVLRSQTATSKGRRGGRRYRPYAFTEHGAVMLATVLNSPVAVQASIQVVRAFVKLRELLSTHRKRAKKLADLEKGIEEHDEEITAIFDDPAAQICAVLCAITPGASHGSAHACRCSSMHNGNTLNPFMSYSSVQFDASPCVAVHLRPWN